MYNILRLTSDHPDFISLVQLLDADLAIRDGADHSFYAQFNKIDKIKHCIVIYDNGQAVACGAIRPVDTHSAEIKRMFVRPEYRQRGLATMILKSLESWALEIGFKTCILETGKKQPEAIALYIKNGYHQIANYGPYKDIDNSLCFEKQILYL